MTVLENVVVGAMFGASGGVVGEREARRRAHEALAFVGLERRADAAGRQPEPPPAAVPRAGARHSRASPRLLLLDEVMAGLNETELAASIEIVRTARDQLGTTILWVEHVMSAVIELAERAIVLNFGKIIAEGAPEVVMRDPQVVDAYLGRARVA